MEFNSVKIEIWQSLAHGNVIAHEEEFPWPYQMTHEELEERGWISLNLDAPPPTPWDFFAAHLGELVDRASEGADGIEVKLEFVPEEK